MGVSYQYERLAIDGEGDAWGWEDGQWTCITSGGTLSSADDLEAAFPPVTFYAPAAAADDLRFMTVVEVAAALRVNKMTVYRLIHDRKLAAKQFGSIFRVPEAALQAYIGGSDA